MSSCGHVRVHQTEEGQVYKVSGCGNVAGSIKDGEKEYSYDGKYTDVTKGIITKL